MCSSDRELHLGLVTKHSEYAIPFFPKLIIKTLVAGACNTQGEVASSLVL